MEEVQQQRIVRLSGKVLLQYSVDAGLENDVVIARDQAHLQLQQRCPLPVTLVADHGVWDFLSLQP